MNKTGSTGFR